MAVHWNKPGAKLNVAPPAPTNSDRPLNWTAPAPEPVKTPLIVLGWKKLPTNLSVAPADALKMLFVYVPPGKIVRVPERMSMVPPGFVNTAVELPLVPMPASPDPADLRMIPEFVIGALPAPASRCASAWKS